MLAATVDGSAAMPNGDDQSIAESAPNHFGRFVFLRLIGQGGMGRVYAAYDEDLDRKVALKVLQEIGGIGAEQNARILREAQAMARLAHPNVVHIYEVGEVDDKLFIAMEFVEGGTLTEWQRSSQRAWEDIIRLYRAAGEGLLAAHEAGLVHRDFKPDNVLLGRDGRPRVADFGLARTDNPAEASLSRSQSLAFPDIQQAKPDPLLKRPLTISGAIIGTPAYMSPEQYCGEPTDARSDQFSFCVALYEAIYGEVPFGGETLAELSANVIAGRFKPLTDPEGVPSQILRALRRGMALEPAQRFSSMAELLMALDIDSQRDPSGVPQARRIFTYVFLAFILAVIVGPVSLYGRQELPVQEMLKSAVVVFLATLAVAIGFRKTLLRNAFHRGLIVSLLLTLGLSCILRGFALRVGLTDRQVLPIDILVQGGMAAMIAFNYLRTAWFCVVLFLVGAILVTFIPTRAVQIGLSTYTVVGCLFVYLWIRAAIVDKKGR